MSTQVTGQSTSTSPYAGYSDARLEETHGYWMSIIRAAKNPAQRERAERNCAAVATEMRNRAAIVNCGDAPRKLERPVGPCGGRS